MVDTVLFPNPVQVPSERSSAKAKQDACAGSASRFAKVLEGKLPSQGITFSQHAQERLRERGISLDKTEMEKLEGAVDDVARKGGRESLVLLGDAALVVSVKNRTVVTALDRNSMQGNVFTNIDSAVLFK